MYQWAIKTAEGKFHGTTEELAKRADFETAYIGMD